MNIRIPITLLLALICLPLTSCSRKDDKPKPKPEPQAQTDTRYETIHATQVVKGIDEFLGKGYRGYQYYANPESCAHALFDVSNPDTIDIQKSPSYKGRFVSGETKSQFHNQFSAGVSASGIYEGFSGEITSNFTKDTLRSRQYTFATSHITQTYYRLTLKDSAPLLDEAKADLETLEPTQLFDKYGTHYLKSIYIGGRVSFSSYADRRTVSENFDIKATVNVAYLNVVKGSGSVESVNESDFKQVVNNKQIDVIGGDPAKANSITDDTGEPAAEYRSWSESVPDFMSIADFADGGLAPIYELAPVSRQAELKKAWTQYMTNHTADVLKEAEPAVVHKNSKFTLQSQDGRFYGKAPYKKTNQYYYPTTASKAQKLQFAGNKSTLQNGNNIKIKTTETFPNSITGKWSKRIYLGAFTLKHWLYYWTTDGAKTNWFIEKVIPSSDKNIRYGDEVYIRNEHFDQYLAPSKDGYVTTIQEPYIWTIEK